MKTLAPGSAWRAREERMTQRRFERMRAFLAAHADEVVQWQHTQHAKF